MNVIIATKGLSLMKKPGNKSYIIEYLKDVTDKEIPYLAKSARELIIRAIEERLTVDPIAFGKPLRYSLTGSRSLRVSRYRIIYHVDLQQRKVIITSIQHRKDSYDE